MAVDLRGQYQSPHAPGRAGYAPDAMAADVLAIADAVARDSGGVHLVGHSMGGLIARDAVLQRPAGFLSLTLLGSGPGAIGGERAAALRDLLALLDPAAAPCLTTGSNSPRSSALPGTTSTSRRPGPTAPTITSSRSCASGRCGPARSASSCSPGTC